jgi:cell filamentation protein
LSQLESKPVIGAYDATHLQQIHARLFEGVFPWAGNLREPQSSSLTSSLDVLFDKLARENRLKGLDGDVWSKRSTDYFSELSAIEPFIDGNELASLEFFRQLANENNMTLRIANGRSEPTSDEVQSQLQRAQSNNLRRILMLAVDPCPAVRPSRVSEGRNIIELIAPI